MTSSFERDLSRGETSAPHHEGAESAPTAQGLTPQLKAMDYGEAVQFLAPGGAADVARRLVTCDRVPVVLVRVHATKRGERQELRLDLRAVG